MKKRPEQKNNWPKNKNWLQNLNRRYPWLKIVFLIAILLIAGIILIVAKEQRQLEERRREMTRKEEQRRLLEEEEKRREAEKKEVEQKRILAEQKRLEERKNQLKTKKLVALTFDDGPAAGVTDRLLNILKEKQVVATFFVLGTNAERVPDLVRRAATEGHEIGNHTMTHRDLSRLDKNSIVMEVRGVEMILKRILGVEKNWLVRPPYGAVGDLVSREVGQPMINWNVDPLDWKYRDSRRIYQQVLNQVNDGAVVLMHDLYQTTVDAVPGIIDYLKSAGYEMVTVSELAKLRGVELEKGNLYFNFPKK